MESNEKLRFYMDETSAPYDEHKNPFIRTEKDDAFDKMLIEKYHLTTTVCSQKNLMN